ncbi:hypothetical protein [Uliginosibacterium gangwonense]|uniref:hypothetical protein n=1 Tax=Uliginosibacterium gangwonense TaxID=392736 RepID=UPI000373E98E|nr:hypothetical protein [Uliginosibacterium gangwonense]
MKIFKKVQGFFGLGRNTVDTPFTQKQSPVKGKRMGVRPEVHTGAPPAWRAQIARRNSTEAPSAPRDPVRATSRPLGETPSEAHQLSNLINTHFGNTPQAWLSKSALRNAVRGFEPLNTHDTDSGTQITWQTLLIEALSTVTGSDASRGVAALNSLHGFDPLHDIATGLQQSHSPAHTETLAQRDAWRLASLLAAQNAQNPIILAVINKSVPAVQQGNFISLLAKADNLFANAGNSAPLPSLLLRAVEISGETGKTIAQTAARKADPHYALINAMESAQPDLAALVASHFGHTSPAPLSAEALTQALHHAAALPAHIAPVGLPGAPAVILVQALAAATEGNAIRAHEALAALHRLDPVADITDAWHRHQEGSATQLIQSADAWHVARELATTPSGLEVLQAILGRAVPEALKRDFAMVLKSIAALPDTVTSPTTQPHHGNAQAHTTHTPPMPHTKASTHVDGVRERITLADLLYNVPATVADEAPANSHPAPPSQAEVHQHTPISALLSGSLQASVPGQAILCAAARLAGDPTSARPHNWALNAVRNDLHDTGSNSDFATIEAWMLKMGKWIDRASRDNNILNVRNPMSGKSAFRALRHGTQQTERGTAFSKHRVAFDRALRQAAEGLRDHLLTQAPRTHAGGPNKVSEQLIRAAVLDHCLALPHEVCIDRYKLDTAAITDITTRLLNLVNHQYGTGQRNPTMVTDSPTEQIKRLSGKTIDMELLQSWFDEALKTSLPSSEDTPLAWSNAVKEKLAEAHKEAYGKDTRINHFNKEKFRETIKEVIANMDGSARLRLTSGGIFSAGLRQITTTLSALAGALFVRGRIDARKHLARHAVFEIAMTTYDMEIVIGTQRQHGHQVGFGGSVGPNIGVIKAGGSADALLYGKETSKVDGISLRIPRIGRPVSEVRAEFAKLFDIIVDGTTRSATASEDTLLNEQAQVSLLKKLLQEFPTLVVNRIGEAGETRRKHGVNVEAGISVKAPFARVTAGGGISAEANSSLTRHYTDATGGMKIDRHVKGWGARATAGVKMGAGLNLKDSGLTFTSGNTDGAINASLDVFAAGHTLRREAVYRSGRILPVSFIEDEHQNADSFAAHIEPQMNKWSVARAAHGRGRDEAHEKANLQNFLHEIRQEATPMHSYGERNMLTPEAVDRINMLDSCKTLAQRQPEGSQAALTDEGHAAFADANNAEWSEPANTQPYSLRSYKRLSTQTTKGINVGVQLSTQHSAEGAHIDNRYDIS